MWLVQLCSLHVQDQNRSINYNSISNAIATSDWVKVQTALPWWKQYLQVCSGRWRSSRCRYTNSACFGGWSICRLRLYSLYKIQSVGYLDNQLHPTDKFSCSTDSWMKDCMYQTCFIHATFRPTVHSIYILATVYQYNGLEQLNANTPTIRWPTGWTVRCIACTWLNEHFILLIVGVLSRLSSRSLS